MEQWKYQDENGVAVIVNNRDTVKVNNKSVYPMAAIAPAMMFILLMSLMRRRMKYITIDLYRLSL